MLRVLLAAIGLVAAVLFTMDYLDFKSGISGRAAQRSAAEGLADALADADETLAPAIVKATELQFNRSRRAAGLPDIEDLAFQLQTTDGRLVYASAALRGLGPLSPEQARQEVVRIGERTFWPWQHETPRWRVTLLEPVVQDDLLLRWLGQELLPPVLVAIPLLLLPLWWAVCTGLTPLRQLTTVLACRDTATLTPLQLDLRYAELQPIVSAINTLLAQARRHVEHERALMHNTAHELRTPLSVIAAQAHALAAATNATDAETARQGVQRGVQRTAHLIEQLLTLARFDAHQVPQATEVVDLVVLCRQHLADLTPLADARGIEVSLSSPEQCLARVFVPALHSILDNLLRNALNHCPTGSHAEVTVRDREGQVCIEVCDDGPGMSDEERERAFERFYRGSTAGPGSGLGLTIVREAARVMNGQVSLLPREGAQGLRVVVTLGQG